MKKEEFIEEVESFQELYCEEYMQDYDVTFCFDDPDEPTAEIKCKDFSGNEWIIPICLSDQRPREIGIDIGDAGTLYLNGEGFYCYLWHEATTRIK